MASGIAAVPVLPGNQLPAWIWHQKYFWDIASNGEQLPSNNTKTLTTIVWWVTINLFTGIFNTVKLPQQFCVNTLLVSTQQLCFYKNPALIREIFLYYINICCTITNLTEYSCSVLWSSLKCLRNSRPLAISGLCSGPDQVASALDASPLRTYEVWGHPTPHTPFWAMPSSGFAARGRYIFSLNSIFYLTATDIATILSLSCAPLWSLTSALTSGGCDPQLGVQSPNQR